MSRVQCPSFIVQQGHCTIQPSYYDKTYYLHIRRGDTVDGWTMFDPENIEHMQMFRAVCTPVKIAVSVEHIGICFPTTNVQWIADNLYLSFVSTMDYLHMEYIQLQGSTFLLVHWRGSPLSPIPDKYDMPLDIYPWDLHIRRLSHTVCQIIRPTYHVTLYNVQPEPDVAIDGSYHCTMVYQHGTSPYVTIHHKSKMMIQVGEHRRRWVQWYPVDPPPYFPALRTLLDHGHVNVSTVPGRYQSVVNLQALETLHMYCTVYRDIPVDMSIARLRADPDVFFQHCHNNVERENDPCRAQHPSSDFTTRLLELTMDGYNIRDATIQGQHLLILAVRDSGEWYLLRTPLDIEDTSMDTAQTTVTNLSSPYGFQFQQNDRLTLSSSTVFFHDGHDRQYYVNLDGTVGIYTPKLHVKRVPTIVVAGTYMAEDGSWRTHTNQILWKPTQIQSSTFRPYIQRNHTHIWCTSQECTTWYRVDVNIDTTTTTTTNTTTTTTVTTSTSSSTAEDYVYTYDFTFQHMHSYVSRVLLYEPDNETWWIFYRSALYAIRRHSLSEQRVSTNVHDVDLYSTRAWSKWCNQQKKWPWWSIITIVILCITCGVIWRSCRCRVETYKHIAADHV